MFGGCGETRYIVSDLAVSLCVGNLTFGWLHVYAIDRKPETSGGCRQ
jgi:hypothetical protein